MYEHRVVSLQQREGAPAASWSQPCGNKTASPLHKERTSSFSSALSQSRAPRHTQPTARHSRVSSHMEHNHNYNHNRARSYYLSAQQRQHPMHARLRSDRELLRRDRMCQSMGTEYDTIDENSDYYACMTRRTYSAPEQLPERGSLSHRLPRAQHARPPLAETYPATQCSVPVSCIKEHSQEHRRQQNQMRLYVTPSTQTQQATLCNHADVQVERAQPHPVTAATNSSPPHSAGGLDTTLCDTLCRTLASLQTALEMLASRVEREGAANRALYEASAQAQQCMTRQLCEVQHEMILALRHIAGECEKVRAPDQTPQKMRDLAQAGPCHTIVDSPEVLVASATHVLPVGATRKKVSPDLTQRCDGVQESIPALWGGKLVPAETRVDCRKRSRARPTIPVTLLLGAPIPESRVVSSSAATTNVQHLSSNVECKTRHKNSTENSVELHSHCPHHLSSPKLLLPASGGAPSTVDPDMNESVDIFDE